MIRPDLTPRTFTGYGFNADVTAEEWLMVPVTLADGSRAVLTTPERDGVSIAFRLGLGLFGGYCFEARLVTAADVRSVA